MGWPAGQLLPGPLLALASRITHPASRALAPRSAPVKWVTHRGNPNIRGLCMYLSTALTLNSHVP